MTARIPNFRGHRALVLHPADGNRQTLVDQLGRFGIEAVAAWPAPADPPGPIDVLFLDADRGPGTVDEQRWADPGAPVIAITGTEAPGRLEAMLSLEPSAMLNKPIRREGIFKALVFAHHNYRQRRELRAALAVAQEQVKARQVLLKAVLLVMDRLRVGEDEAFAAVRRASMSGSLLIEAFAVELVAEPARNLRLVEQELRRIQPGRAAASGAKAP
ncbi:Two-component response regulator, AmiR/NasT family, consists of REC and RNA-binding antiterminator (ANTAR) domains [Tistlia consotensis]|uniref:Two-component response regulator, AmiR/NasT family, consists of REC and RNA-binding antiterminator (ANTAR) domains n=1 Tax=Tistlia consotensis USBA 355 TaxID=560819 RepID=A0A1Y6CTZ6_9PROT|nr:ANTAR domain-containing protein [Tistlia consotensis]SMF79180.1 Two-component response regulator, AmiR/NasT family, consists of REC and RNA-binding antiterminator (ANTAR) domains [Tistlia consotensis USBA 355]SNS16053.1 Two-component response regulator, AmiR/NasT family, consists of REC and RNA-binding antiterminator (ANTAR) domains [Tistlia consotensis]